MKKLTLFFGVAAAMLCAIGLAACGGGKKVGTLAMAYISGGCAGVSVPLGEELDLVVNLSTNGTGEIPDHELECTISEEGIIDLTTETKVEYDQFGGGYLSTVDLLIIKGLKFGKTTLSVSAGEGEKLSFSFEVVVENYTDGLEYGDTDVWGHPEGKAAAACVGLGTATETDIQIPTYTQDSPYAGWTLVTQVKLNKEEDGAKITSVQLPESIMAVDLAYSHIQSIVIPEGVKSLHENAFKGCAYLEEITLPQSLGSIWENAFANCTSLKKLVIPENCTYVSGDFLTGSNVTELVFPKGLKAPLNGLTGVERLTIDIVEPYWSFELPDTIGSDLKELTILGGVIPMEAFTNCHSLTKLTLEDDVTEIRQEAFRGCENLETVSLGKNLKIGKDIFKDCLKIKDVTTATFLFDNIDYYPGCVDPGFFCLADLFPMTEGASMITLSVRDGVDYLPSLITFRRLEELILPTSVTEIDGDLPIDMSSAPKVTVRGEGGNFRKEGSVLYFQDDEKGLFLLWVDPKATGKVTLSDGITSLPDYAFENRKGITSVEIPASVTKIGEETFGGAGLTELIVPEDSALETLGESAFSGSALTKFPETLGNVTNIPLWAFSYCENLTTVTMPDSVTDIQERAFENCSNLATLEGGENVEFISQDVFKGTKWLKDRETVMDEVIYAFHVAYTYHASSVDEFEVTFAEGTKGIANYALQNDSLIKVTIPATVRAIGDFAIYSYRMKSIHFLGTQQQWKEVRIGGRAWQGVPTITYGA